MKISSRIKFKIIKFWEYFVVFLLLSIFILEDGEASYYEENILPFYEKKLPDGLQFVKFHLNYSINLDDDMALGIVSPNAPFPLNDSLYIKRLLEYCIYEDFISVLVRTKENDLKIITLKSKPHKEGIIPLDEMLEYKIYSPKEFYNDTIIFDKPWKYYVPCTNLRYPPPLVGMWGFIGGSILLLLIGWVFWKIYYLVGRYKG